MKRIYTLLCVLVMTVCQAQDTDVMFVNAKTGLSATSVTLEITNQSTGAVLHTITGVGFPGAAAPVSVPANTLLTYTFKTNLGSTIITSTNKVYDANQFRVVLLTGEGGSTGLKDFTGAQSTTSGMFKIDMVSLVDGMPDIDVWMRDASVMVVDDLQEGDLTFTFDDRFAASDDTLDIFENGDVYTGLKGYVFPGQSVSGEYVLFFNQGTTSDMDMYMVQTDGTLTKLNEVSPYSGSTPIGLEELISNTGQLEVFPNPSNGIVSLNALDRDSDISSVMAYDQLGVLVTEYTGSVTEMDVSSWEPGLFHLVVTTQKGVFSTTLLVE